MGPGKEAEQDGFADNGQREPLAESSGNVNKRLRRSSRIPLVKTSASGVDWWRGLLRSRFRSFTITRPAASLST